MKRILYPAIFVGLAFVLFYTGSVIGGRGGRGGGGGAAAGRGGAAVGRAGGAAAGRAGGGGVVQGYGGGSAARAGSHSAVVGPAGGSRQAAKGGGSVTTKGGSTVNYKGAAAGRTTPGGVQGGRAVGGVQVTTPGGRQVTNVGKASGISGPGGNAVGGRSGTTIGTGPGGAGGSRYQGGVAIGPQGGVAGGSRVGGAVGPGGAVVGGARGGVASGPYGAVAGGARGGVAAGPYGAVAGRSTAVAGRGTYYRSNTAIRTQGIYVRQGVAHYPCFRPGWYARSPGAWFATGWAANSVWRAATWASCSSYCGYNAAPIYYDYGENIVYQDDGVYMDGQKAFAPEVYAQQAITLADSGRDAKATKEEEWMPLGVFAMVQGEEKVSNYIFQLAVNKQGVMRGNYYDAVTDSNSQIFGSVDKKTQRAAWTVGDRKTPIYEAGIANLTKSETTMLVHYGTDRTQQFTLIRVEEPEKTEGK